MSGEGMDAELKIDVDALRRRYEEERRKRLRADADAQFEHLRGKFSHFAQDPFAEPGFKREAVVDETDVLIIGGGFAGVLVGGRLREQGVEDIRVVDNAGDFGGTWYWNRYPGVACDVEAYVYLPLLEETGYVPSEKYAKGAEILAYCQQLARRFRLYEGALFQTEITGVVWEEARQRWIVSTDRGDEIAARFVVCCKGLFSNPKLPGIPGIEDFQGHSFHTSRWDYDYTGGDANGGLVGLQDKTVGVIGTGSTGIQCIPHLAQGARHLYVFQRTPSTIDARNNRPTDPAWWRTLEPGWHQKRVENFTYICAGVQQAEDLVDDGWTDILRSVQSPVGGPAKAVNPADLERAQFAKMENTRRRVDAIVKDKATAEALKPYYHYLCKRPGFSDEYLEAFNRPNVTLVDTGGRGVERITQGGVVVAGREYRLDLLVYATGFDVMTDYTKEAGFDVIGRAGLPLSRHWAEGTRTLYAMQTDGFPNFFMISLVQAGISFNYMHIADEQAKYIAEVISACGRRHIATVEPTRDAVDAWVNAILANSQQRRAFLDACTPSYINHEGRRDRALDLNAGHPAGPAAYIDQLRAWRAKGTMEGLAVRPETAQRADA